MASTSNATTVLYGTAWSEDDLLAQQKQANLAAQAADGRRRHFEYDWTALAALSPAYRRFVEGERARLGEEHPLFATQYALRPLPGAGRLLTPAQLAQMAGGHSRRSGAPADALWDERGQDAPPTLVAGLDIAGAVEEGASAAGRDSTVLTLAALGEESVAGVAQPVIYILDHVQWVAEPLARLQVQLADLLGRAWRVRRVCVDATGLGAGVASFLSAALGPDVVQAVVFTAGEKSRLGYELLAAISAGRLRMYADDGSPEWREFWAQMRACRRQVSAGQMLSFGAPADAHDDYVVSAALCVRAARGGGRAPAAEVVEAGDVLSWQG
jgi:hypothetical protein